MPRWGKIDHESGALTASIQEARRGSSIRSTCFWIALPHQATTDAFKSVPFGTGCFQNPSPSTDPREHPRIPHRLEPALHPTQPLAALFSGTLPIRISGQGGLAHVLQPVLTSRPAVIAGFPPPALRLLPPSPALRLSFPFVRRTSAPPPCFTTDAISCAQAALFSRSPSSTPSRHAPRQSLLRQARSWS